MNGSARKLKDNAADWHNLMLRWDKLNEDGFNVAAKIISMRRFQSDQLMVGKSSPPPSATLQHMVGAAELQDECFKLQDSITKMVAVVSKMERLMVSQQGIQQLEEFQFGLDGRKFPLCHSWTTKEFEESTRALLAAFSQELQLKQIIVQEIAHSTTSELCVVYLSCWLHQPFIPTQTRLTLEALLLETGHRQL
ncbi:cyclin-dependent kinase 2-interacting protein [Odontesthes bonariensis]|uniref:cyclin-dependent kinase 2-interacting protein n=1 Tax=Odontesthes bonariensis TaxID=219752 RepID=UPI003F58EE4E